jgi:hypothetical protein
MRHGEPAKSPLCSALALGLGISIALMAGCQRSTSVTEIPEASRKALIQRKVDVKPGRAKSAQNGSSRPKGRANGQ